MHAVPWMSSLKHGDGACTSSILNALVLSPELHETPRCHGRSDMNSSTTSSYSLPRSRSRLRPLYIGSSSGTCCRCPRRYTRADTGSAESAHTLYSRILLGDAHPARAEVAQAQDPLPSVTTATFRSFASDGGARDRSARQRTLIVRGDVHALLSDRERVVCLASLAHRGGVHVRYIPSRCSPAVGRRPPRRRAAAAEEDVLVDGARCSAKAI